MTAGSRRLLKAGFWKKGKKKALEAKAAKKKIKLDQMIDQLSDSDAEKYADHDIEEVAKDQMVVLDYPSTKKRYNLVYETPHESIEPLYHWTLGNLFDLGFPRVIKITDLFTASEHSSFWGSSAQRLGLQQDKVMTFMASIGKLVKELFQLVREMRWLDERLTYYDDAKKGLVAAEITLKGIWVDMVDGVAPGGQKTNANLFIMAQQLNFTTLPDFFFAIHPKTAAQADKMVDKLGVNEAVKRVLKRKLYAYLRWRDETERELSSRRKFTLRYLRQHFNIIKMYMQWVKPYLKAVRRLTPDMSSLSRADLVSAFEGSLVEIEVLAINKPPGNKDVFSCILLTFEYTTKPTMQYQVEYQHRGPLHMGQTKITWRSYAWSWEEIQRYVTMRDKEDFELLSSIDASLNAAMEELGDDLNKYLEEAGERAGIIPTTKKEEVKIKRPGVADPLVSVVKGFGDMLEFVVPKIGGGKKKNGKIPDKEYAAAAGHSKKMIWQNYKIFKKAKQMLTW